ncbi:MAG: class I SAM-dependent methyltransferase, partial [Microcystis sp.]
KFREQYKKVKTLNKDSRTYNPEGEFDYIFSSFADHHIKTADKAKYFDNIKQNLKPNGLMIVGDEFLRKHDPNDRDDRDSALKDYHSHIIDIAKGQGEMILAELERQALQSGLEEKGDFKVSCEQYEKLLKQAKFKFKKEKIGPENIDNIGGVYVYTAWLPT